MAATTQKECSVDSSTGGAPQVSTVLESVPCGHGVAPSDVSPFQVAYIAASPIIECGACRVTDRPLWWGICGWCGADEEDFEEAA